VLIRLRYTSATPGLLKCCLFERTDEGMVLVPKNAQSYRWRRASQGDQGSIPVHCAAKGIFSGSNSSNIELGSPSVVLSDVR
jgi:hypothetical protein